MLNPYLQALINEKIVTLKRLPCLKFPFPLEGIIRLVDQKGKTVALILGKEFFEEIEEDLECLSPRFLATLGKSRRSGRVSSKEIEHKLGL